MLIGSLNRKIPVMQGINKPPIANIIYKTIGALFIAVSPVNRSKANSNAEKKAHRKVGTSKPWKP